jgi:uncharacterized damage-inducible protein DinB
VHSISPWFDRSFAFGYTVKLLPNLLARLRGTPARLEEVLRSRPVDVLTRKPGDGWSAQEQAGHLLDLEPMWLARVEDYVNGSAGLTPTDLQNGKTNEANHNARPLDEILREFRAHRENLLRCVNELHPSVYGGAITHPRLKTPMRLADHLYFVAEHDDHHLAGIWELVHNA